MADADSTFNIRIVYDANGDLYSVIMKKETWVAAFVVYINDVIPLQQNLQELQDKTESALAQFPPEIIGNITEVVARHALTSLAAKLHSQRQCGLIKDCIPIDHLSTEEQKVAHMCLNRLRTGPRSASRAAFELAHVHRLNSKAQREQSRRANDRYRSNPPELIARSELPEFPRALPAKYKRRLGTALRTHPRMRSEIKDKHGESYFPCWRRVCRAAQHNYAANMHAVNIEREVSQRFGLRFEPSRLPLSNGMFCLAPPFPFPLKSFSPPQTDMTMDLSATQAAEVVLMAPERERERALFCKMMFLLGFGRVRAKGTPTPPDALLPPMERGSAATEAEVAEAERREAPVTLWFE